MNLVAERRRVLAGASGLHTSLAAGIVLLGVLVIASLLLRTRWLDVGFWIDEGLSVGIASHPLLDIPGVLRQDGSPPLYYLLLHGWMSIFGRGEVETHALSLTFAVLTVPAGLWAGRSMFGARAGWFVAGLVAINPFLTYYAQETRMYSLVTLLALITTAAFVHAFVNRRRAYLAVFAGGLVLLLYTHNWGLFFAAAALIALWPCSQAVDDRRALLRDGALAFGAVALLYAPWLPTLAYQVAHTGAPWADAPGVFDPLWGLIRLLGGEPAAVALLLAAGSGIALIVGSRRGLATLLANPSRESVAVIVISMIAILTIGLAWASSQVSPAWAWRYLAIIAGPLLLIAGVGLARAGRLGVVAVALVALLWATPRGEPYKSNVRDVASVAAERLAPGDLVVSTHPEQVPVLSRYLPDGLRYATSLGPVADPAVMDWRDALDRLRRADPATQVDAAVDSLAAGQLLLHVRPIVSTAKWDAPWTALVRRRAYEWGQALEHHSRLTEVETLPFIRNGGIPRGVRAVLYRVGRPTPGKGTATAAASPAAPPLLPHR